MNELVAALARKLLDAGCRHAFGVTGSGPSLDLITELERGGARYYPVAHEAAAAIMSGTVARATGTPAVAITIKGPGFTNALPGIASNFLENNPGITICEAYDASAPLWRQHKRMAQFDLARPITKARATLRDAVERFDELWDAARAEVPGPIHLELACDARSPEFPRRTGTPAPQRLPELLARIAAGERVAVIVGAYASRAPWRTMLAELKVPVFTTVSARGVVDEAGENAGGVFTGAGRENSPETRLLPHADVIVGIALRTTELLGLGGVAGRVSVIDVVDAGMCDGLDDRPTVVPVEAGCFERVIEALASCEEWGVDLISEARSGMRADPAMTGWLPGAAFDVLNQLPYDHALVLDTGSFCTVGEHLWTVRPGRPFLGSSNGRYMGVAIPSAVGLALSYERLPVVCVAGDGGVAPYIAELRLVAEENLPICVLLMRDGRYGSIVAALGDRPHSSRAVEVRSSTWWRAVETFGWQADIASSVAEFEDAMRAWRGSGPIFLELPFDPARYAAMTTAIR